MNSRNASLLLFSLIALLMIADVVEDLHSGAPLAHVLVESPIMLLALAGVVWLWKDVATARRDAAKLRQHLTAAREDAERWAARAKPLLEGLAAEIDAQFDEWSLTRAEREVALLMLKGFRFEELSKLRGVSERTVRQQSLSIYRKAGLHGRHELTAFFLEDLFLPSDEARPAEKPPAARPASG